MQAVNTWVGFLSTLVANIIIMIGSTSLYTWLAFEGGSRLGKHRKLTLLLLEIGFVVFLQLSDWSSYLITKASTGYYWTYLNMEIIILFNFTLTNRNLGQLIFAIVAPEVWIFSYLGPVIDPIVLVLYLLVVAVTVLTYIFSAQIQRHVWSYVTAFGAYTVLAFMIADQLYAPQSVAAWWRQVIALIVIEVVCAFYGNQMFTRAVRNRENKQRATHDELTSLRNFASFNRDLETVFREFRAAGPRYAIHEIDIDYFKKINDTYGHPAGNVVLQQVAHSLEDIVDELEYGGRAYRTGGEEFTVLLTFTSNNTAVAVDIANQIRTRIRSLRFDFDPNLMITVSIGQERVSSADDNYLDVYKRVDKSLYQSKNNGRDVITVRGQTLERR